MKNLKKPNFNNIDRFKEIATSKNIDRREKLLSLMHIVIRRYEEYEMKFQIGNDLSEISKKSWNIEYENVLKHCYKSNTGGLDKLKKDIKKAQDNNVCQYCGIIPTSKTFDHYLPKSDFPEYSVLADNLIPCCYECNIKKGDKWVENGRRQILHLYFDEIPKERFLFAEVRYENQKVIVNFKLENNAQIEEEKFEIIKAHYESLSLMSRFKEQVNEVVSSIRSSIKYSGIKNFRFEKIKKLIKNKARAKQDKEGINSWEGAIIEKLAESEDFIEDCRTIINENEVNK